MKDIYVVFQKTDNFVAKAIRWFTKSNVNHIAIMIYSDEWQDLMILEADVKGVTLTPARKRKFVRTFKVNQDISEDVVAAKKYIGESYDFTALFAFGFLMVIRRLWQSKRIRFPWTSKGQLCSEIVARIFLKYSDINNPQWISPEDMLEYCLNRPDLLTEIL